MSGDSILLEETSVNWVKGPPFVVKLRVRYRFVSHSERRKARLRELREALQGVMLQCVYGGTHLSMAHAADTQQSLSLTTTFTLEARDGMRLSEVRSRLRLLIMETLDVRYTRSPRGRVWRWKPNSLCDEIELALANSDEALRVG